MKKTLLTIAALLSAGSAQAATLVFQAGAGALLPGDVVVNDFDTTAGITGVNFQIDTGTDNNGAEPFNSQGSAPFLSVLAGGSATIAAPSNNFAFDLGSLDSFNTLVLNFMGGATQTFMGGMIAGFPTSAVPASGDRTSPTTNGRVTVFADPGQNISSFTLLSGQNSFEIDRLTNVAPIPEPATWAMMILGFGLVGASIRRRRNSVLAVTA